jgi:hypothetical protein
MIWCDNRYTVDALYRLGFSWPIIDEGYIGRMMGTLASLRFFGRNAGKDRRSPKHPDGLRERPQGYYDGSHGD